MDGMSTTLRWGLSGTWRPCLELSLLLSCFRRHEMTSYCDHLTLIAKCVWEEYNTEAGGGSRARRPCLELSLLTPDTEPPPSWQACKFSNSLSGVIKVHFQGTMENGFQAKRCGCSYVGWTLLSCNVLLCPTCAEYLSLSIPGDAANGFQNLSDDAGALFVHFLMIEMPFSLMFRSTFHDDADALFADVSSEVHLLMTEMPFFRCIFSLEVHFLMIQMPFSLMFL